MVEVANNVRKHTKLLLRCFLTNIAILPSLAAAQIQKKPMINFGKRFGQNIWYIHYRGKKPDSDKVG